MSSEVSAKLKSIDSVIMRLRAEMCAVDKQIDVESDKKLLAALGEKRYSLSVEISDLRLQKDALIRKPVFEYNDRVYSLYV